MIRQGIRNFFCNLKYFFTPLGALLLGAVLGLSAFFSGVKGAIGLLVADVTELAEGLTFDLPAFGESLLDSAGRLDWDDPFGAVSEALSGDWLKTALTDALEAALGDSMRSAEVFADEVERTVRSVFGYAAVFLACTALGLVLGFLITRYQVRRTMARRAWWKYFFVSLLDAVISAGLVVLGAWLTALWTPAAPFATVVALLLFGAVALLEAYVVHARGRVPFRSVLNFLNICKLLLVNLLIFGFALAFTAAAVAVTGAAVGVCVGLAMFEIAFLVAGMNAEAYVKERAEGVEPREEKA